MDEDEYMDDDYEEEDEFEDEEDEAEEDRDLCKEYTGLSVRNPKTSW